ncbi:protein translocase subunit SecD [Pajaroellobacter abortibovis]|uniref:Protein translocase subunit SecD n=1 Tax=Pajaroellobacter abortibovis TaxID=1882918 RepID=A0A1L6MVE7_9BACT|nr:protein translocase subunit SecD [Pajaroellobacter abortibovis]APR99510.1 protein-export membrane protein SecD [Pajaroellobacter abortibovis]
MNPSKRSLLFFTVAVIAAGCLAYRFDLFWGVVSSLFVFVWLLVVWLPIMNGVWRLKVGLVAAVVLITFLVLWPTLKNFSGGRISCPAYVADHIRFEIVPGLDLRGGLRLVYTVEGEEAVRDKRDRFAEEIRHELADVFQIRSNSSNIPLTREDMAQLEEKVHVSVPETNAVRLMFKDKVDIGDIEERFRKHFLVDLLLIPGPSSEEITFKIRPDVIAQIQERAVQQAKEIVHRRIDELGLREAQVTSREEDIIVEIPGENRQTFEEIKEIIRRTARLEFKIVDDETDFFGRIPAESIPSQEGVVIQAEDAPNGPGRNTLSHYAYIKKNPQETMAEVLDRFKKWVATLSVPDDHQVGFQAVSEYNPEIGRMEEGGWRTYYLFSHADLTGESITDAMIVHDRDQGVGQYYVSLTFSPSGADRFEKVTGVNVRRRFAILLDGIIDSAPVIKSKIAGGRASITLGAAAPEQQLENARKLELVLRSGALPAPLVLSNESMIGPSLGRDSIALGIKGMVASSALVLVFMLFYYHWAGIIADVAVLFNLFLQLAILASFNATMTLPGIAGLALTIGMSVDANVLINERIREELRRGRRSRTAIEAGYTKAFSSILDGHVTVFISGLILAQHGSGPVKGFAVTLIVGILTSLFTGVFCTRLVFDWWVQGTRAKRLSVGGGL